MSTKIRPEVSTKRTYYISKHRYYELKHFCLQYNEWRNLIFSRAGFSGKGLKIHIDRQKEFDDPTADEVIFTEEAKKNIDMINTAAASTDDFLKDYILEAVTEEKSYTYLKMIENMPCSRDNFYVLYHKFFWILSQLKHAS